MIPLRYFVLSFYFGFPCFIRALLFPNNDVLYKYMGQVKIGVEEQTPYISSFDIYGNLQIRAYVEDSDINNAYLLRLTNIEYSIYNGPDHLGKRSQKQWASDEIASLIQEPFMAIYNETNLLNGLKFQNTESTWSKNLKKAIATNLQFDISTIDLNDDFRHSAFLTDEPTIHGLCSISYDVHTINYQQFSESNGILVTKSYNPKECTEFIQSAFSHSENFRCYVEREEDLITSTRKEMHLEKFASSLYISKSSSFESLYYFPWMHMSEVYHLKLKQILELEKRPTSTTDFPNVDFQSIPIISEIIFERQMDNPNFIEDITYGRHKDNRFQLILKINKIIFELVDYIEENRLIITDLNFKHEHIVNRLITTMAKLDVDTMKQVYEGIHDPKTIREETARKIFLEILPHIGTTSSCLFILNIVAHQKYNVSDQDVISILTKFPSYVRKPTENLLMQIEDFLLINNSSEHFIKSKQIKKSAILSFASLIYKVFKRATNPNPPLLERYIQYIAEYLQDSTNVNYEMKLVHVMALRNIQVGNIDRILIPIISGELVIHKTRQEQMRLAAIFAVAQAINHDKELVHNLFWPILSDSMNSLRLRIMAYDMLISQLPDTQLAMNIHWLMTSEQNRHLYHYHYTTIKSLAHLKEPCLKPVTELAKKILRMTKNRNIFGPISGSYIADYLDLKYGYGETYKLAVNIDDKSGLPQMGIFEYYQSIGRRSSPVWGIYWNTNIFGSVLHVLKYLMINKKLIITDESVKEILRKTKGYESAMSEIGFIEIIALSRGRIVEVSSVYNAHLNGENMLNAMRNLLQQHSNFERKNIEINWQSLLYRNFIEMTVSSNMGLPIIFSYQQPLILSTRTKIEFATSNSSLSLKIMSDNRIWLQTSCQIKAYNPIADIFHSVQKASTIDVVFPIEFEILYNFEKRCLKLKFPRTPNTKIREIRKHVGSFVSIIDNEGNHLKEHCSTCSHHKINDSNSKLLMNYQKIYNLQNLRLQFFYTLIDCDSDNLILLNEEWIEVLKNIDIDSGNDPIYVLFLSASHKIVNTIISPNPGTCKNYMSLVEDDKNISHIEIDLAWETKPKPIMSYSNNVLSNEDFYFSGFVNTISSSNFSSVNFWGFTITLHGNSNMDFYFIQKIPGKSNIIGCLQLHRANLPRNTSISWKIIFNVDISELDQCGAGHHFINGIMTSTICNYTEQDIVHKCLANKENAFASRNNVGSTYNLSNHSFKITDTQNLQKYELNIKYSKIPEEISSTICSLDDNIRNLYYSKVKYTKNYTETGYMRLNFFVFPNGVNVCVFTPSLSYEAHMLPLNYIMLKNQRNAEHLSFTRICTIFPETIILNNNEKEFTRLTDWTLISGDYVHFSFVIFAKVVKQNKLAVKLHHGSHVLEIQPINSTLKLIFNNIEIKNYKNKKCLPSCSSTLDDSAISIESTNAYLEVKLIHISVNIQYNNNSITVMVKNAEPVYIDGLCANSGYTKIMDNTEFSNDTSTELDDQQSDIKISHFANN